MPCGSPHRLESIRVSPDRRLLASPRSLSQLTAPFVAIPSQAINHTASLCRMILTSPADACANPMHGFITGVPFKRARNFRGAPWPVLVPLALRRSFSMTCCILLTSALLYSFYSFAVLEYPCPRRYTKEVIRLQVPLQPPCYDFSPLAEFRFDHHNMR